MAKTDSIPIETLQQLLEHNSDTGKLVWKPRPVEMFGFGYNSQIKNAKSWNTRYAGKQALAAFSISAGYLGGTILGQPINAHRVIWALHYGEWPVGEIDHVNHIRTDNRIENLRAVTLKQNRQNKKLHCNNRTGHCGVKWIKLTRNWRATINVDGKEIHLGFFATKEEAAGVRQLANVKYGFHPNHGMD